GPRQIRPTQEIWAGPQPFLRIRASWSIQRKRELRLQVGRRGKTMERARISKWIVAFTIACASASGLAQIDPLSVQRRAIERIDRYVDHYRRTGDFKSQVA